jgi:hypothetical protein
MGDGSAETRKHEGENMKYSIITKGANKNFPAQVSEIFDTPEALIAAINNEEDSEQLFIWANSGFAISTRSVKIGKSIPAAWIKAVNYSLINGISLSPRPGAKEASAKLQAALNDIENIEPETIECPVICRDMSCLWAGNQSETKNGRCPDCGGRVE